MPFSRWLQSAPDRPFDLVIRIVGDGRTDLTYCTTPFARGLADRGFEVMARVARADDIGPVSSATIRVSTEPIHSLGNGCDVLLYLDKKLPDRNSLHLQAGSVLLCDAAVLRQQRTSAIPEGVITYPIPFSSLSHRRGLSPEKVGIATGVLSHVLGLSSVVLRRRIRPDTRVRHFDTGVNWASSHLKKRDIHALPSQPLPQHQLVLNVHQAMALGFEIGKCRCGSKCSEELKAFPEEWIAAHVNDYWHATLSDDHKRRRSRKNGGQDEAVVPLLAADDPTRLARMMGGKKSGRHAIGLVPSGLVETLRLIALARRYVAGGRRHVWLALDDMITNMIQTVPVPVLVKLLVEWERQEDHNSQPTAEGVLSSSEGAGDHDAEVGLVAWGSSQGVVREAVSLCRSFGLKVAALYPKLLWPVPAQDLSRFAETVKKLVVVEPNPSGHYTQLIQKYTHLRPSSIFPHPEEELTPMDIFLREDLGGGC
jgi:hypothetical protein